MKVLTIVGARPQFVKAAALSRAFAEGGVAEVMVHTGQHHDRDLSEIFFAELSIPPPAYELGIHGGNHGAMTGRMLEALEPVLVQESPSLAVVYGDTNSTLAGALAASKIGIPVAHIEAGLRSFNRRMPEEVNRVVTDHLSDLLFCPTSTAVSNLRDEGIIRGVHLAGDVMFDAVLHSSDEAKGRSQILNDLALDEEKYAVATIHRAENTDDPNRLSELISYLRSEAREQPIVFPVHPRTRAALQPSALNSPGIKVIGPLGYLDMTRLVQSARTVYTDSGGLQKEAYFHGVPCVTLRSETEWLETIECGWNRLWTEPTYKARRQITEYGEGNAAREIVEILLDGELQKGP